MINAQNSEISRKMCSNGESGLQEKKGTEPIANGCAENGTDADVRAEHRADAGIDDGKKSVGNINCTVLIR